MHAQPFFDPRTPKSIKKRESTGISRKIITSKHANSLVNYINTRPAASHLRALTDFLFVKPNFLSGYHQWVFVKDAR